MKRKRQGKQKAHIRLRKQLQMLERVRQEEAAATNRSAFAELEQQLRVAASTETQAKASLVSKNEAINTYQREQQILQEKVAMKEAELKRVDRLVEQFLSVQIIGHGQQLLAGAMQLEQPGRLRRT